MDDGSVARVGLALWGTESVQAVVAHAQSTPRHAALVPARFVDRYAVAGTPQQVRDRLAALLADTRVQRLVVSPQIGAPGTRITRDFIELFADSMLTRHSARPGADSL